MIDINYLWEEIMTKKDNDKDCMEKEKDVENIKKNLELPNIPETKK